MDINVQLISTLLYEMSLSTIFMKNFLNIISTEPLLKQIECLYQYKLTAEFLFYSLMFCLKVDVDYTSLLLFFRGIFCQCWFFARKTIIFQRKNFSTVLSKPEIENPASNLRNKGEINHLLAWQQLSSAIYTVSFLEVSFCKWQHIFLSLMF